MKQTYACQSYLLIFFKYIISKKSSDPGDFGANHFSQPIFFSKISLKYECRGCVETISFRFRIKVIKGGVLFLGGEKATIQLDLFATLTSTPLSVVITVTARFSPPKHRLFSVFS